MSGKAGDDTGPVARVSARGAARARRGHPWIFRGDLVTEPKAQSGEAVRVYDERRNFVGQAFWATASPIALRILSRRNEAVERAFFTARLQEALARRQGLAAGDEAIRVVHGEADLLPGMFVDRYADTIALQAVSEGAERLTPLVVEWLRATLAPRLIIAKNDTSARDFERLPRGQAILHGDGSTEVDYREGENRFHIDLMTDLKTGAFLDQRFNHLQAAALMPDGGTALDAFSYHGGFALALATRAAQVTAIESDENAATRLRANVAANGRSVEVICGNAFDELRRLEREGQQYDLVVLDPPAFAKRHGDLPAAHRAYKELNLRALRLTRPGGLLVTCSCSGKVTAERFDAVLAEAATDVKRPVQLLERRGAGPDHPVLFGVPETEYLKVWILRVLGG